MDAERNQEAGRGVVPVGIRLVDVHDQATPDRPYVGISLKHPWPGLWLHAYDPDAHEGLGEARWGTDENVALRFSSFDEAKAFWFQQSTLLPELHGQPNRPLTVCSISVDVLDG